MVLSTSMGVIFRLVDWFRRNLMIVIVVVCVFDIDLFIIHEIITFFVAETSIVATVAATFLLHSFVFRASILEPHFYLRNDQRTERVYY